MASTNKTTHYELSQYVGSDKPTYLTDYNNDMSAIDTGIYNAQTKGDSAYTLANTADGKADTAITNAGLAQGDASSALGKIGTMANLTTTEKTTLVGATNEINYNLSLFNLTTYSTINITPSAGSTSDTLNIAKNANGSLFKVYGQVTVSGITGVNTVSFVTGDTGLRPSSAYTIVCAGVRQLSGTQISTIRNVDITVNTNGTLTWELSIQAGTYDTIRCDFFPCLYFNSDFGDEPTPE